MELRDNLSNSEMKELFYEIIKEEEKKYQIDIKAFPVTILEFYKKEKIEKKLILLKDKKHKLKEKIDCLKEKRNLNIEIIFGKINQYCNKELLAKAIRLCSSAFNLTTPLFSPGWFEPKTKRIFFILDKYKKNSLLRECKLDFLIIAAYHEARHLFQEEVILKQNTYESFLMQIEKSIMISTINWGPDGPIDYKIKHDRYMLEIDANNYSINKTIEYIKKYPEVYRKFKEKLENRQKKYKQDLELYDAYSMFEKINKIIKKDPQKILNRIQILRVFYKDNGEFKTLTEILKEKDNIDSRIIELVLGSNSFLKQLDLNSLNNLQQEYMLNLLNKIYSLELKKIIQLEPLNSSNVLKEYLHNIKESLNIKREFFKILNKKLEEFDKKNKKEQLEIITNIFIDHQKNNQRTTKK